MNLFVYIYIFFKLIIKFSCALGLFGMTLGGVFGIKNSYEHIYKNKNQYDFYEQFVEYSNSFSKNLIMYGLIFFISGIISPILLLFFLYIYIKIYYF
jgi:hypothetical protein